MSRFIKHTEYRRRDLHSNFGGNPQSGISPSKSHPIVMLFASEAGEAYGYKDGWHSNTVFHYTGEGQHGDMEFLRGNKAIRDHVIDGRALHLFVKTRKSHVRYEGEFRFIGHHLAPGTVDGKGQAREAIVFHLELVE